MKEIAEEDAAEERTGDYAKPNAIELQLADEVPDSNGEINAISGYFVKRCESQSISDPFALASPTGDS